MNGIDKICEIIEKSEENECKSLKAKGTWFYYASTRCIMAGLRNEHGNVCRNTGRCHKCFVR